MHGRISELKVAGLTLRGITEGGVETCLMVPELKLMFDIGRCPPGALKFDTVLCSHGHQDHLGGLPYFVSQRGLIGKPAPEVHVPAEVEEPLHRILAAWSEIEGFSLPIELHGHEPGDAFAVDRDLRVHALRTVHRVPSLAYLVERTTRKLKPEYAEKSGEEIKALKEQGVSITEAQVAPWLCVTGDTKIDFFVGEPRVHACKVLVHEVTSWDDRRDVEATREWGHTHVDEIIEHAEKFEGDALVLVHRSLRHTARDAEDIVRKRFPASVRDRVHVFA